jgi:GTPase SAR1 family protein
MKHALLVMGPAGSGKTTFCGTIIEHLKMMKRPVHLMNLDPAAPSNRYLPNVDIMEFWPLKAVMKETGLGPNGSLLHCLRSMIHDGDFLRDALESYNDDYLLVDLPGQIEIFLHTDIMKQIVQVFLDNDYHLGIAFLLDYQFVQDENKFLAGRLAALSAMIRLNLPHVNIITKCDTRSRNDRDDNENDDDENENEINVPLESSPHMKSSRLKEKLLQVLESCNFVDFLPFNRQDQESVRSMIIFLDNLLQNDDFEVTGADITEDDHDE